MYFDVAASTRLATIEQCQQVTSLVIESTGRVMTLYAQAGRAMLQSSGEYANPRSGDGAAPSLPNLFVEHLHLADSVGRDFIRLLESQVCTSSRLLQASLQKVKGASPPMAEIAIDSTEFAIAKGAELANEVGAASLKMIDEIESEVAGQQPSRQTGRKAAPQA